jgi:hypothetical protein
MVNEPIPESPPPQPTEAEVLEYQEAREKLIASTREELATLQAKYEKEWAEKLAA